MLKILYGACNNELRPSSLNFRRPKWFSKIKCFNSIHQNILNSKFKDEIEMIIFMDGNKSILSDYIEDLGYKVIYNNFDSGPKSWKYRLDFADNEIKNSDIYFLEDDYLHQMNAIDQIYPAISHFGLVTGYDMTWNPKNNDLLPSGEEDIQFYNNMTWRNIVGTTLTWGVSAENKEKMLQHQQKWQTDKEWKDFDMFRDLYRIGELKLYQPLPSLSTHVCEPFMSPFINWETINEKF